MPPKDTTLAASKDADLLKAVIKASGGITARGSAFWSEVAAAMSEDVTSEAARKRFDKFKPSASSSAAASAAKSSTPGKDADLLKAVIQTTGGVTNKGAAFWKEVAGFMEEGVSSEAARKRFDKFRVKGVVKGKGNGEIGSDGVGEAEDGAGEKAVKKRAPAKPKAAKGKKAAGREEKEGSDEDGVDSKLEDGAPEENVRKGTKPRKPKGVKSVVEGEAAKPEANVGKKRVQGEKAVSDGETEEELGQERFVVESPAGKRGRATERKTAAKKAKFEVEVELEVAFD